jgi:RHS repeat-associated protein
MLNTTKQQIETGTGAEVELLGISFCFELNDHRNQQYSVTAITNSSAGVVERYAYQAYGEPTILDASASILSSSSINNRYTYTGREWDGTVGLYHFRARWMSGLTGRFLTRDPIGFEGSQYDLYFFCAGMVLSSVDPSGLDAGTALPWQFPLNPPPRVPGGPPLPPGAPPPKVSYQQGLDGLDNIGPMLANMCSKCCNGRYCDCIGDAAKIRDALKDTWTKNYGYGPKGPNQGAGDDTVGGYFCDDWANMFQSALTKLMLNSGCMSFHRMAAFQPPIPGGPMHAWVRISIGNGGGGCEANADDGWGNGSSSNSGTPLTNPGNWMGPIVSPGPF